MDTPELSGYSKAKNTLFIRCSVLRTASFRKTQEGVMGIKEAMVFELKVSRNRIKEISIILLRAGLSRGEVLEMLVGAGIFKWGVEEQVRRQVYEIKKRKPIPEGKDLDDLVIWALFKEGVVKNVRTYLKEIVQEAFTFYLQNVKKAS